MIGMRQDCGATRCSQPRLLCLPLLRRAQEPLVCGLLVAALVGAQWLGGSAKSAGSADGLSGPASAWPGRHHGPSTTASANECADLTATTEARDRCELRFRVAAPDGVTIAAVECTYERLSREKQAGDAGATDVDPAADRRRWMWVALAWSLALLVCVLLSQPEQWINLRRPRQWLRAE